MTFPTLLHGGAWLLVTALGLTLVAHDLSSSTLRARAESGVAAAAERGGRNDRTAEAARDLAAVDDRLGRRMPAALLEARAVVALQREALEDAASLGARAAVRHGDAYGSWFEDAVRGAVELARCERARAAAKFIGGDPGAWSKAIRAGETARDAWRRAACAAAAGTSRTAALDGGHARRNAERMDRLLAELRSARDRAEKEQERKDPPPPPETETEEEEVDVERQEDPSRLDEQGIRRMLEDLARKQQERRQVRRDERDRRARAGVEKDW